ncbi:outer membrane protein assembly factor BamB [Rhizobacter sp. Root404]|uniref:outer membrane protein assembly factor BamB n=1 Tax=Rhizobacter sp. Root404 TaxID=1736528 RepID=UPI000A93F851|nr:outer membrane protein assembly factor BamB [Rhizobacter sp. Root404]
MSAARLLIRASALALVTLLAACAGGGKPKPEPLEALTPKIAATVAWTQRVDGVQFPLTVAATKGQFTVAGNDGTVMALDADSGREIWRGTAGAKLSAGVGSDGRYAAVVTRDGELVVFDQGQVKWRKPMGGRVTTAPLVAGERVFVLGVDRGVQAFDVLDGRKLWVLQRPGDPLTLAQSGVLAAFKDTLIVGQGPRMAGVDPLRGTVRWDVAVGSPRGANEIERLADLVGPPVRNGDMVCARSFQAAVGCVNAERGLLGWSRNGGGTDAIGGDAQFLFGGDASDRLTAWKAESGETAWSSDKLLYRTLSAPAVFNKSVVFGDEDGTLHWLNRETGEAQLRSTTDGGPISVQPVVSGTTMLVVTRKGGLFAFRQ